MDLSRLSTPLAANEIEFRVQSINNGGYATILPYKDARADMKRLDAAVGCLGWKREHLNGNANCVVSIWCKDTNQWVSKEDTGTESNADAAKGLASDSFKRACFNWGIGRELYDYPVIQVKLFENEYQKGGQRPKATWNLRIKEWKWYIEFDGSKPCFIAAKDQNQKMRYQWGQRLNKSGE